VNHPRRESSDFPQNPEKLKFEKSDSTFQTVARLRAPARATGGHPPNRRQF
jgi:hypothetical protein